MGRESWVEDYSDLNLFWSNNMEAYFKEENLNLDKQHVIQITTSISV